MNNNVIESPSVLQIDMKGVLDEAKERFGDSDRKVKVETKVAAWVVVLSERVMESLEGDSDPSDFICSAASHGAQDFIDTLFFESELKS